MPRLLSEARVAQGLLPHESERQPFQHVMACLDRSHNMRRVLREAALLADLFGAGLSAVRVMPGKGSVNPCADPVEWELTRREELVDLQQLAESAGAGDDTRMVVACGPVARSICEEARQCRADLLVLGTGAETDPLKWGIGGTTRHLAERFSGSVLVVPNEIAGEPPASRRIVVPVDGSPQAEAALRVASIVARNRAAELVILHALPEIGLPREARPTPEDEALYDQLRRRAERAAKGWLQRLRRLLPVDANLIRVRQLAGQDPRRALMQAICEERGELLVLSARGLGSDPDLPIGSTADYLLSRAVSPVLLIRNAEAVVHRSVGLAPRRPAAVPGLRR